jgi:hypothetical protein
MISSEGTTHAVYPQLSSLEIINFPSTTVTPTMARPGPSSCQSCRTKKLKCNRVQPCSNCSARAITCVFVTPPLPELKSNPTGRYSSLNYDAGDIMNRLERLESLVLPKEPPWQQATPETTPNEKDGELESLQHIGTRDDGLVSHILSAMLYLL